MKKIFLTLALLLTFANTSVGATEVSLESKITGLYVAFFNRAADQEGLDYWTSRGEAAQQRGDSTSDVLMELSRGFSRHPSFGRNYEGMNNHEFVEAIYRNVLGREGDSEGIAYWARELTNGMSRSDMVSVFVEASLTSDLTPENYPGLSSEELAAAQLRKDLIANKVSVALAFTRQMGERSNVADNQNPENDPAYLASIEIISEVTEDMRTVSDAIAYLNSFAKVVTIYIHGFSNEGFERTGVYGNIDTNPASTELADFVGFSVTYRGADSNFDDNILIGTSYYGDQPPHYYTQQDIRDINSITAQYGGGIPRYAMIVAKYAKHIMAESGATKVNFLSVSMGSLVTRWLIEKDVENLSSEHRIAKWLSIEGVVGGNYAASDPVLVTAAAFYEKQSPEVEHMSYNWIDVNFGHRAIGESPYYATIQLGFESSTRDDALYGILSSYLIYLGRFYPNDGNQLVKDTYFTITDQAYLYHSLPPTHSYFHENHTSIKNNSAAWTQASLFFTSGRRVRITLAQMTIADIHEDDAGLLPAEIVCASAIHSPVLEQSAGITRAIDRRDLESGALPIHPYSQNGGSKAVNQVLFDGFVNADESVLGLTLDVYEIDNSIRYNIEETQNKKIDDLGTDIVEIPLQNNIYSISSGDWSGEVKVEVFDY